MFRLKKCLLSLYLQKSEGSSELKRKWPVPGTDDYFQTLQQRLMMLCPYLYRLATEAKLTHMLLSLSLSFSLWQNNPVHR